MGQPDRHSDPCYAARSMTYRLMTEGDSAIGSTYREAVGVAQIYHFGPDDQLRALIDDQNRGSFA
jgi:hypothetical protein